MKKNERRWWIKFINKFELFGLSLIWFLKLPLSYRDPTDLSYKALAGQPQSVIFLVLTF